MESIIIHKKAGGTLDLTNPAKAINITKAEQHRVIVGEDVVTVVFDSGSPVDIGVGDWIAAYGDHYYINQQPKVVRSNTTKRYNYTCTFEGSQYELLRAQYLNTDVSGFNTTGDFSLTGDLKMFLDLIINNAVRVAGSGSWTLGDYPVTTDTKTITYSSQNCLAVLQDLCQQYSQEFFITQDGDGNKTLNIGKVGTTLSHVYEYGPGNGLYTITRQNVSNKQMVNRLYVFGSTENLKTGYRDYSPRLRIGDNAGSYLEDAASIAAFGVIEGIKIFDDIKPEREGAVTAVVAGDTLSFIDTSMDFDLNAKDGDGNTLYLIDGTAAKVHFNSGALAGYEFNVSAYNNTSKKFTLVATQDERGQQFPDPGSSAFQIAVGDKYVLADISMPESYETAAEAKLKTAGQEYLDTNKVPHVQYGLLIGELYLRQVYGTSGVPTNVFNLGDFVHVKDTDLAVDKAIRIIEFTRDMRYPYRYAVNIADTYDVTIIERLIEDNRTVNNIIRINKLQDPARARNTWKTTQEALQMVFDPDGYFKDGNIRPLSIETAMLAVETREQQLALNNVIIEPNYLGDENVVGVLSTSGTLSNFTIDPDNVKTWQIASSSTTLPDNAARYIYAKCAKADYNDGTIVFDTTQRKVDSDPNYYYFLLGDLHSVMNGIRWSSLTYGATTINGGFIKTGTVQSADGLNFFDLDGNRFNLGSATSGVDWNVTTADTLTIRGGLVVNPGGASAPLPVFRGEYDAEATYYKGDTLTYNGSTWQVTSATPISGVEPTLTATEYQVIAQRGDPGAGQVVRVIYAKNDDADNAPTLDTDDANPAGWSQQMPQVDTYWLLATEEGDYLATQDGDQFLTTVDGEYIWGSTEVLKEDGTFDHWSAPTRISGRNGIPNEYTEYRFEKNGSPTVAPTVDKTNATPTGWTVEMPTLATGEYLWLIKANKLPDGTLVSAWSDPVRTNGVDGGAASKGDPGPFLMYRGEWDEEKVYTGTAQHIDGVKYSGAWYVARVDAGDIPAGTLPTDTDYWNTFAGQFESVATGLLLAELAYIENLGVKYVRTSETGQRIEIDGVNNNLIFYDQFGNVVLKIDDNIDSAGQSDDPLAGMRINNPNNGKTAYITGNGVFVNASGVMFLPSSGGYTTNASVVGLLQSRNNAGQFGISAAVVGIDQTDSGDGTSESWGGYFNSLRVTGKAQFDQGIKTAGLSMSARDVSTNYQIVKDDVFVYCYNNSGITVSLPSDPEVGDLYYIRRVNSSGVTVAGDSSHQILGAGNPTNTVAIPSARDYVMCHWDGQYWHTRRLGD